MSDKEISKSLASSYGQNFGGGEAKVTNYVRAAAKKLGADLIQCHTGQRFYFADTVFEILYTVENFAPATTNALNTSSILVRSTTTDASGKSTSVMVMGDVTGPAMALCNDMYGEDLRCEIVQVAHHGYATGVSDGSATAIMEAYKHMAPSVVLYPNGESGYKETVGKVFNTYLISLPSVKEICIAGGVENIFELPYTPKKAG
jgi:hypothetical protein